MNVIFYTSKFDVIAQRLMGNIAPLIQHDKLEIVQTLEGLIQKLQAVILDYNKTIAVIITKDRDELNKIIKLGNFFDDLNIILILPDREINTMAMGHKIYPRFVSYIDGDFTEVKAVFEKLCGVQADTQLRAVC